MLTLLQGPQNTNYLQKEFAKNLTDLDKDLDKSLTTKVLSDTEHKSVMQIVYIYYMESLIYVELYRVCREKGESNIKFYEDFTAIIRLVIHSINRNKVKEKIEDTNTLFKRVKLATGEIEKFEEGFTCTIYEISTAVMPAF